ncbi:MAG: hypothetical protein MUO54_17290 [Anaerolineales bacterium]|nr:hypothetical protein [Anaerolineales bacterium]
MSLPEIQLTDPIWRSLAIATMIIAILTPIIMVILAFRFSRIIKRMNKKQLSNQKIVEKRIEVYDKMVPKLNDIFCFYCYIGNWNEITPTDVLRLKRELDKDMNIYASLFSDDLSKKYMGFKQLCFVSMSGWEHDEKIKSLYQLRQENNLEWNDEWIQYFDTNNVIEAIKIKEKYDELIESFKVDLVIFHSS